MRLLTEQKEAIKDALKRRGVDYDPAERPVEAEVERAVEIVESYNDMTKEYPWLRPIQTGQVAPRNGNERASASAGVLRAKNGETW